MLRLPTVWTLAAVGVLGLSLVGCSRMTTWMDRHAEPSTRTAARGPAPETGQDGAAAQARQEQMDAATSALLSDPVDEPPQFVGKPVADDGDRPARFVGVLNLYGELPGGPEGMPDDALDNLQQVSFTPEGADFDADVSPDGKHILFASTQHRPTADLYHKPVDSQTVTQVTSDPANDTMPAFSPDGRRVAFCSNRSGSWDIYIKSLNGGHAVQVTDNPAQELHPSWSPDGAELVFSALGEQSGQWEMVVVDVANPAARRFIGYGLFPEFSPTGDKIVYQRARYRGTRWFSIWTIDYADGQGKRPTEIAASANAAVITPTWSPDGSKLAFATVVSPTSQDTRTRPRRADVWVVNIDGTERVRLTTDHFVNLQPTWGPDGQVFFVSNRSGTDNIWAVRPQDSLQIAQPAPPAGPDDAQASVPTEGQ
jgi:dipeptidyl aminopeptidase/acylaminoacyl peptidase